MFDVSCVVMHQITLQGALLVASTDLLQGTCIGPAVVKLVFLTGRLKVLKVGPGRHSMSHAGLRLFVSSNWKVMSSVSLFQIQCTARKYA